MNKQRILQALENVKSNPYGKWGILNIEQRRFIKELCDSWLILDDATNKQMEEIERLNNIINKIEEHFVFLKMNSTGGNKEFFEDILVFIKALKELKGSDKE